MRDMKAAATDDHDGAFTGPRKRHYHPAVAHLSVQFSMVSIKSNRRHEELHSLCGGLNSCFFNYYFLSQERLLLIIIK